MEGMREWDTELYLLRWLMASVTPCQLKAKNEGTQMRRLVTNVVGFLYRRRPSRTRQQKQSGAHLLQTAGKNEVPAHPTHAPTGTQTDDSLPPAVTFPQSNRPTLHLLAIYQ